MTQPMLRSIALATLVCGTLDIASAFYFAAKAGPVKVLQSVASGPFGDGMNASGGWGALIGATTHFSIMAVMVTVLALTCSKFPGLIRVPVLTGIVYGLVLYSVMYWIVLPLRWPEIFPQTDLRKVANALFSHIVCVGIPMSLILAAQLHLGAGAPARASAA